MEFLRDLFNRLFSILPRLVIVAPDEGGVFIRCGRLKKSVGPGVYLLLPWVDELLYVNVMERVIDLRAQSITTADGESVAVSGAISFAVLNVEKAILNVEDFDATLQNYTLGVIAHYVNSKNFSEVIQVEKMAEGIVKLVRDRATREWGLKIHQVWITDNSKHKVIRVMGDKIGSVITTGEDENE